MREFSHSSSPRWVKKLPSFTDTFVTALCTVLHLSKYKLINDNYKLLSPNTKTRVQKPRVYTENGNTSASRMSCWMTLSLISPLTNQVSIIQFKISTSSNLYRRGFAQSRLHSAPHPVDWLLIGNKIFLK